jgi:hypothetical protein
MAEAETKLNKVKQVLRRFRKKTQDKQPAGKEGVTKETNVNGEHGNKEAMKGNQNAKKLSKKDTLIEFIKKQTNIDLSKYVDDKYSKRTYLNVDWKKIPKDEQNLIRRLASANGGQRFSLSDNGGLGMALVYGSKLQEQDKASVTDVNGEHGNKTAMLGNQNAFKGHLANKETVKFVNTVKGEPYE